MYSMAHVYKSHNPLLNCSSHAFPSRSFNTHTTHRYAQQHHKLRTAKPDNAEPSDSCVVGIDLGTTNSAIAVIEGGAPVIVPNQDRQLTTPSIVAFLKDQKVIVGSQAKRQAAVNPLNTFSSIKRFIGKPFSEVGEDALRTSFKVIADSDSIQGDTDTDTNDDEIGEDAAVLRCEYADNGKLYPEEISSYVVSSLLADAEEFTGRPVKKAVISVPAYFNEAQRDSTITAGKLAGLDVIRLLREPIAAALAYGLKEDEDQTVLVFDLGGGTFDVSLLEVGGGVIEVLSTGGDAHLGGDDWDAAIIDWLIKDHLKPAGIDAEKSPPIMANLKAVAEASKIKLSTEDKVMIRMPVGQGIEVVLTRQMLEGMTKGLFRRARLPLDQACWQAGVDLGTVVKDYEDAVRSIKMKGKARRSGSGNASPMEAADLAASGVQIRPKRRAPVSKVLLVGGATRMPGVRRFVQNMTGIDPREENVDPDLAVALGAAVQAGVLEGRVSDLMIMDVWQASLMRAYAMQLEIEAGRIDARDVDIIDDVEE